MRCDASGSRLIADRASACGGCRQASGCGAGLLARGVISIPRPPASEADTAWEARFPAARLLQLCAGVFPGLASLLLFCTWLAQTLFPAAGDAAAIAGFLAGLLVGAACLRLYDAALGRRDIHARLVIVPSGRAPQTGPDLS